MRWGPKVYRWIKKTAVVAIEIGDMVKFTASGRIEAVSTSADSTSLVGVAMKASPAAEASAQGIRVALIGQGTVFEMSVPLGTANYTYGDAFVITGAQTLAIADTNEELVESATNVVAICAQDTTNSATVMLAEFLPGRFQQRIRPLEAAT